MVRHRRSGTALRLGSRGDATPGGVRRLPYNYVWDAGLVRDDLRDYAMEHLSDADGVLVVVETGILKKGTKGGGATSVHRQYSGTAGRKRTARWGYSRATLRARGRVLMDRELYLPQGWSEDWERYREAGVPVGVRFQTKQQLARKWWSGRQKGSPLPVVCLRHGVRQLRRLRRWLEEQEIPHVLAIKSNEKL